MMKNKSVLLGILIIVIVIFVAGCGFYNLLLKDDFQKHFEDLGYTISDKEMPPYETKSYLVATKEEVPYKIEYYEFDNEINAKKVYEKYKKNIANYITTDSTNKETTGAVFAKTVAVSTDEYIIISRVKNTLIFIAGTNEYSKDIDKILEDIKY
jgi:hypothetical protein